MIFTEKDMSQIGLQKASRIKAIHAACRKLHIDGDQRHEIQIRLTGKNSLSDMAFSEVSKVLDHLNQLSRPVPGKAANEWSFVFRMTPDRQTYGRKIFRMAERVGKLMNPPVDVASKAYIEGITAQMRGTTQPLEFCDPSQLHKVVQALEVFVKRHGG
jgi:phage gp16-like protein